MDQPQLPFLRETLLFLVLVVVGVVMLLWVLNANRGAGRSDPVAILKERYARGEISLEEYEEHKRNLER